MSSTPAGWYPQADGRQRYWDGNAWTEHFAPGSPASTGPMNPPQQPAALPPFSPVGPQSAQSYAAGAEPPSPSAGEPRPWFKKKRFLIPGGIFAFAILVNSLGGGDDQPDVTSAVDTTATAPAAIASAPPASSPPASPAATAAPPKSAPPAAAPAPVEEQEPVGEFGPQPAVQRAVVAAVISAQAASESADNDLARGAALRTRTAAICKAVPKRVATKWSGKVVSLDANGDGKGVLEIEIAPDVKVKTWNNSFSDVTDETLIEPTDPLFDKVLKLKEDQIVTFSGKFPDDEANCIRENSLTLRGSLDTPGFIMKFSDVS